MRTILLIVTIIILTNDPTIAQIGINNDNSLPDPSAILDIKSTNKGLLVPRLTQAQISTITNPENSLLVFCTTDNSFYAFMAGTSEWKQLLFGSVTITPTCGTPITDARDGKVYNTVQIGTQCWMSQNLNIGERINGSLAQANNGILEKYCFNNLESNCDIFGGLYQWNEMMQFSATPGIQGNCPEGWHLPTDAELTVLTNYLGGLDLAGGKMKQSGTETWSAPNTGATDESGFTVLPGSFRDYMGAFSTPLGQRGSIWTSTPNGSNAWDYSFYYNTDDVIRSNGALKTNGFSVRCIKN